MRIAHLITRMILGGAQENTLLTCEDLLHQYHDKVLLVTGPPLGPEGSLLERAARSGVPVNEIQPLRREIHPGRDWASYRALKSALAEFRPEVVHTHSGKAGLLGRLAADRLRVPCIVHTVHGAPFHPYQTHAARSFFRQCEAFAARRCDALVSVADAMTNLMVENRVAPREKFTTVYSGMEVEPFLLADAARDATRRRLGYSSNDIVVGKIARLFHLKGHADVIAAARVAIRQEPRLRFLFVGDGVLRPSLEAQIEKAGLGAHFQFVGLVPPEEIPALLGAMDIVVHASLREGLARVLPQALIAGKPVVSYDIDGAREVVIGEQTGFLLRPQDVTAMAAALVRLAADPTLRQHLGTAGRARFTDTFRHERMTAQLRGLYEQVLARKSEGTLGSNQPEPSTR